MGVGDACRQCEAELQAIKESQRLAAERKRGLEADVTANQCEQRKAEQRLQRTRDSANRAIRVRV